MLTFFRLFSFFILCCQANEFAFFEFMQPLLAEVGSPILTPSTPAAATEEKKATASKRK